MHDDWLVWLAIVAAGAILLATVGSRLSSGARLRRRLRRTHGRVVSKAKGPSVQLSVKTPKK